MIQIRVKKLATLIHDASSAKQKIAMYDLHVFFMLPWWESKPAITREKPLREEQRTNKLISCMALRMEPNEDHNPAKEEVVSA